MKRPLVVLTLIFCLGIIFAAKIKITFPTIYCLALILFALTAICALKRGLGPDVFLACLVFILGICAFRNCQTFPRCHISRYAYYKNNHTYALKGFISSDPVSKINKTTFLFRAEEISFDNFKARACGDTLAYIKSGKGLGYGDALIIVGSLCRPFNKITPGRSSYRDYLANQGVYSILNAHYFIKLNYHKRLGLKRFALYLKSRMEEVVSGYLSPVSASIVDAMILGERRNIPPLIYNSMVKSGTVHILVVSGFNVGIVFLIINLFLSLLRLNRRLRIYAAMPLLILYCLVTGSSNPVVRATVMAVFCAASYLFKREADIYNSLSLAALSILILNPGQLFDVGFQLSFASVASIVYFYPKIKSLLRLESLKNRFIKAVAEVASLSLSAWLGTAGFIAYYFKLFTPVTVLANLFIVPLATLITLCGFSLIIFAFLYPPLAYLFALPCELLAVFLISINSVLIKIPGASLNLP